MKNMLVFEFDNNDRKIELRKDLLTSKGMGDNFSELDIVPIPSKNLEHVHSPYKYGLEELEHLYSIIEFQNCNSWPHVEPADIIKILPLADYLGLDVVINYCIEDIKERFLISEKEIFKLLIDFPQLKEKKQCEYSEKELHFIFHNYFELYDSFPPSLTKQLLIHSKKMHHVLFDLKNIIVKFDYKFDHLSLKEFVSDIFELLSGNKDRYDTNYFNKCKLYIDMVGDPAALEREA
ncbi:MAG: hypothetical protein CML47_06865 [Rhodobacteraceae bacterium]|nr:MAG: hypothetical protein CML47_06865 [Paracoccaceae bacterium]|tara:strand:- start:6169 stop:6873 length:705 start_codon:yes stop_codon:yes gene_type:complete